MELLECKTSDYRDYISFVKGIYSKFPNYKDSSSPILKQFLYKRGAFCSNLDITPIMVKKEQSVLAACMYIISNNYDKVLQLAFFEAVENCQEAVDMIMENARMICSASNLDKIVIGLNGHVNYGLGFLCNKFDGDISYGSNFTPPYYIDYFRKYNPKEHKIISYCGNTETFSFDRYSRVLERVKGKFKYRHMNFKRFQEEMKIYTDLNNICFKEHPFYFERTYKEDYELFKELRCLIREDNIIFVQKGDKPVGYMLWYPDYNELLGYGKIIGLGTYIKNRISPDRIQKLKIVEIAILPEYQNSGAILGLFNECFRNNADRYGTYESSWILEDNYKSRNFGVKLLEREYKQYVAYEIAL